MFVSVNTIILAPNWYLHFTREYHWFDHKYL